MNRMNQSLKVALNAIWLNRGRAVLTMLGIIIGISSVVAMLSLGRGFEEFIVASFQDLGADQITIVSSQPESDTRTRIEPLTMTDVEALGNKNIVSVADDVGALFTTNATIIGDADNTTTTVRGVTPNMNIIEDWDVEAGSYITASHIDNRDRVVILGRDVVKDLYGDENYQPLGDIIKINNQTFEVIGVMEPIGSGLGREDGMVIIPITTLQTRLIDARVSGGYEVSTIYLQVSDQGNIDLAVEELHTYFYEAHDIGSVDEEDYTITDSSDLLTTVSDITGLITIFLAIIAGISLLVGGIGIMNIMLVSVTERTREIGLRKAVGARPLDILSQFLMESLVISLLGGALGLLMAVVITVAASQLVPDLTLSIEIDAVLLASFVSIVVGVVFGLLPANNAAKMHPIDALRFE